MAQDPSSDERVTRLNEFFGRKLPGLIGFEVLEATRDAVVGRMKVTEPLIAGTGFLFAPAVIALADTLCACGIGPLLPEGTSFTTIEMKCNFLGSAREGETVVARAVPLHVGRTTHVWDAEVTNEDTGKTIALFRCTQMILNPQPAQRGGSVGTASS